MSFSYGTCEFHDSDIDSNEFEWKGCWTCQYFTYHKDFHYIGATEAAKLIGVSLSTIHRWIKQEKLEGLLFTRGRTRPFILASRKKWFVSKSDVLKLIPIDKK